MTSAFQDDDLVYVNPEDRTVVEPVKFDADGNPLSLPWQQKPGGKPSWRKFFPWGTYRSMRNTFRLEGKRAQEESSLTMDEAIPKFMDDHL